MNFVEICHWPEETLSHLCASFQLLFGWKLTIFVLIFLQVSTEESRMSGRKETDLHWIHSTDLCFSIYA